MHCSQVSSGGDAYQRMGGYKAAAAPGCKPAADCSAERSTRADKPQRSDEARPARNPLAAAMMEALKGLVAPTAAAAADETAPADAAVPTPTGTESALSVKDAAMNFANELYSALRAAGESAGAAVPKHRGYGHGGGYGNLAQSLQHLAQSVAAPAAPGVAPTPAPAPGAAKAAPPEPPARAQKAAPPEPPARAQKAAPPEPPARALKAAPPEPPKKLAEPSPAPAPITINISINVGGATPVSAVESAGTDTDADTTATDDSPLLNAFKDLMAALNPKGSGAADAESASQRLQAFLQQIAQSLGGDAGAQTAEATLPAKGSLINVTA